MLKVPGKVDRAEAHFLKSEIESGNNDRSKRALQILCRLYRNKKRLQPGDLPPVEYAVLGALSSGRSDEKVRRWCLSALSQFGSEVACWAAVETAIQNFPEEPQVVSSGIAALFKMNRQKAPAALLKNESISSEILTLSALQTINPKPGEFPTLTLNVENADDTSLKLGLVLVGLDRSPEFLFDKKYPNREMVKKLGGHHDDLVSQYSAWAVAENSNLTVADLGIDLLDITAQPGNVRHYVYRLFAAESSYSTKTFDIISEGSQDPSEHARLGNAMGLRDTYYEGIQDLTLEWFYREDNADVRAHLLDHVVRHADKQELYEKHAKELFEDFASDGGIRDRMIAAAAGKQISKVFRRILHEEDEGLFGNGRTKIVNYNNSTTNTNNNHGTQVGNTAVGGDANNSGLQMNLQNGADVEKLLAALLEARNTINQLQLDQKLRTEVVDAIVEAEAAPTAENVTKASGALKKVAEFLGPATHLGASVFTIADGIAAFL